MEIIIERGCGLDVHKETVVACIMGTGVRKEIRTYTTMTNDLLRQICGKISRSRIIRIVIAKDQEMFLSIVIGIFDDLECGLSDYEFLKIELGPIRKNQDSLYQTGSGRTFFVVNRCRCNKRYFC